MSDYFTKQNTKEVGPGPETEIEWLLVEEYKDLPTTRCLVVTAKTAYQAMCKADRLIQGLNKNVCKLYQNPKIFKEKE